MKLQKEIEIIGALHDFSKKEIMDRYNGLLKSKNIDLEFPTQIQKNFFSSLTGEQKDDFLKIMDLFFDESLICYFSEIENLSFSNSEDNVCITVNDNKIEQPEEILIMHLQDGYSQINLNKDKS